MRSSFFASTLATAAFIGAANAHSRVFSLWVDGADQGTGAGVYTRQPPNNNPVKDLTSTDVRCNVGGTTAVSGTVEVAAGALVQPEWFHDSRGDDIIDGSHVGPIVAYLAPAASNGEGDVWVKISEDGYDGSAWAVTRLIANKGKHDVTIPSELAAGDYILRAEILALHEADSLYTENSARGIQLYPSCSQITVTGSGSSSLPEGVAFPGAYTDADAGIHFNVYGTDATTYVIPGPAVWDGSSSGTPAPSSVAPSSAAPSSVAPSSTPVPSSAAPSSVPAPSSAAPSSAPAPSSVVPSSAAPSSAVPSSAVPASSAIPTSVVVPSSVVPSSSKPATSSAAAPSSAAPTSVAQPTSSAVVSSKPTSTKVSASAPQPTSTGTTCSKDAYNCCMDAYNACADQANAAHRGTGGSVSFATCETERTTCLSSVSRRHPRDLFRL